MSGRNRATGWQHAKLSGHENEALIAQLTKKNKALQNRILKCAHINDVAVVDVEYGGLAEKNVDCIFSGKKTKSKTDMSLFLSNGERLNVSIKKERSGQVFLIGIDRFIQGFERQYLQTIPSAVKRAIALYFGSAHDIPEVIFKCATSRIDMQTKKHRLVAETLKAYDFNLANILISWINANISNLFDFCFSRGLAKNKKDYAQIIWYKNMLGENELDKLIYLPDILKRVPPTAEYGNKNGGSTIQLPFGFVQWHSPSKKTPGSLQFHHNYSKIVDLLP
ncbi:MAG: hypothetical protein M0R40_10370 [Firmicutes bacterium]|nr:hypothetical protein [Bacillota bacterium]